jgi:alpha-tubulin suppressor-like RCC1 family protein
VDIDAGARHSAFILENNDLFMCGEGENGKLGLGETDNEYLPRKTMGGVYRVSCGEDHTLIINLKKHLLATGSN